MTLQHPIALSDFEAFGGSQSPADGGGEPHPEDSAVATPLDAARVLGQSAASAGPADALVSAAAATGGRRCAWLSGGRDAYDPFVLNWSGSPDSSYDFIAFGYEKGMLLVVDERWYSTGGWQWASKGSSYTTNWTPYSVSMQGGSSAMALYFVWNAAQNMYLSEPTC